MDTTSAPSASNPGPTTRSSLLVRGVTLAAGAAVAAGGVLHLCTWDSDYRDIPDGAVPGLWVVKLGFPVNAVVSIVVASLIFAVALGVVRARRGLVLAAGLAVQVLSIIALVASRGPGFFGWSEKGYSGDAGQILAVEIVAVVLLVAAIVLGRTASDEEI